MCFDLLLLLDETFVITIRKYGAISISEHDIRKYCVQTWKGVENIQNIVMYQNYRRKHPVCKRQLLLYARTQSQRSVAFGLHFLHTEYADRCSCTYLAPHVVLNVPFHYGRCVHDHLHRTFKNTWIGRCDPGACHRTSPLLSHVGSFSLGYHEEAFV